MSAVVVLPGEAGGVFGGGAAAHGWVEDPVWTASRVATLIGRKFHVSYSVSGATLLMHRLGYSPRVPARRAAERDEQAVEGGDLGGGKRARSACGGYVCFEDEAGFTRRPPRRWTRGRRNRTTVVTVSGRRSGRLSVTTLPSCPSADSKPSSAAGSNACNTPDTLDGFITGTGLILDAPASP
nr:winged helix-turn-helix domain-containing protein [Streptomyces sp. NRRL F-2664]